MQTAISGERRKQGFSSFVLKLEAEFKIKIYPAMFIGGCGENVSFDIKASGTEVASLGKLHKTFHVYFPPITESAGND